jgi:hypothetical protein
LARVHPDDYITAGNAGGQSVSFPALESLIAFYRALKKDLLEEEARQTGADTGRLFQVERPAVGGVDV